MRRRMSAEGRREQILEGAMHVFAAKGFRGTTTREIARHLGISEALMFRYFPSKKALYRAIIQKRTEDREEIFFSKEASESKDDRMVFRSIAMYLIRQNMGDPTFMRLILYSSLEGHDLSRIFFENKARQRILMLSRYIRQRIKEKAFKNLPPILVARAFIGMILFYIQAQEIHGLKKYFPAPSGKVVDALVDTFLYGLKGKDKNGGITGILADRSTGTPSKSKGHAKNLKEPPSEK